MNRRWLILFPAVAALVLGSITVPASAGHNPDAHENMFLQFSSQNAFNGINSDIAFWGNRAYVGNYAGFRIFEIRRGNPVLLSEFECRGPQNDPSVWDTDGDGNADLLVLSVDRTMSGPGCGSVEVAHDDPTGWEGIRLFDVSNPTSPQQIGAVYLDCGSHTNTLYPDFERNRLIDLNASYPLRPGPTCGAVRGPEAGRDPLHGVIQAVEIPLDNPAAAFEVAELPINYPGDPDNQFVWSEHGLPGPPIFEFAARACHDISVFLPLNLVAGACNEQLQLWPLGEDGLPDTSNPLWVFDDEVDETGITGDPADPGVVADFWHSVAFSWDGQVVNAIDESFGDGCPPVTPTGHHPGDTGRMFFFDADTGGLLSTFMIPRPEEGAYCSAHLGAVIPSPDRYLMVNAWYMGGTDVIDFTDPSNPQEVAFYDLAPDGPTGGDNWSAYWYVPAVSAPHPPTTRIPVFGNDGVHSPATGRGFQLFRAFIPPTTQVPLDHLNPQVQEFLVPFNGDNG